MKYRILLAGLLTLTACGGDDTPAAHATSPQPEATRAPAIAESSTVPPETKCAASPATLCPADDSATDPAFAAYRARLLEAVSQRSESMLLPLIAPDVRTSFGAGGGIAEFKKNWKTSSRDSRLWPELETIMKLGGTFRGEGNQRMFWTPYVYSTWPDSADSFESVAAIRAGVTVREKANSDSPTVATLDWSIVRLLPPFDPNAHWQHVRTADGHEGWVTSDSVRSPLAYRAGFARVNGEWKMTALVAGD
jgi:hypothetical protein